MTSPIVSADGTVYITADKLYALAPDGKQKWAFGSGLVEAATPALGADGTLYLGTGYAGKLVALVDGKAP